MFPNERPIPNGRRMEPSSPSGPDETLRTERLQIERKVFLFALKENARGRFLRITEDVAGRRDTIILPATGLADFRQMIERMIETSDSAPPADAAESE